MRTDGADLLVQALADLGVDVVFLNPGTDTAPVQEALAHRAERGLPAPRLVLCPHEAVALAAAHAYHAVTGRPQVVMVHVDVGTQNLGSMLHNAARAEAGVVIIAGRTPTTSYGEAPGGRDIVVHWHQDVPDQVGVVRAYVKAALELTAPGSLALQLARAVQLAGSAPAGPVYVTVAREVLMAPAPDAPIAGPARRLGVPSPAAADPAAVTEAAAVLAAARRPVVTTTRVGRDPDAVAALVRVAELLGAPVIERRERMNFPTDHPLYVTDAAHARDLLRGADAVLVVDSDVPWVPAQAAPPDDARVVLIDADPVKAATPGWIFPVDVCVRAEPRSALRQLAAELERTGGAPRPFPVAVDARPTVDDGRLQTRHVMAALDARLRPDDLVLDETVTNSEAVRAGLGRTVPGTWFQAGGSGLGWAVGGAVGARLAAPDRRVVAVVGDGTFQFSNPVAALWTAASAAAPVLVVVLDNGGYAASRRPVLDLYPGGASDRAGDVLGTRLGDLVDLAAVADACGAHGEHVRSPDEAAAAIRRGLDALDAGRSAVIVAHVGSPWFPPHPTAGSTTGSTTAPDERPHRQRREESSP